MSVLKKSGALVMALMLSACVDAPATTPQVKEIAQDGLGLGAESAPRAPREWWKAFADPQVDRLAALVILDNPTLSAALSRMRAAQSELAVNRAEDLPQVVVDGMSRDEQLGRGLPVGKAIRDMPSHAALRDRQHRPPGDRIHRGTGH